jgi:hypothetical protein
LILFKKCTKIYFNLIKFEFLNLISHTFLIINYQTFLYSIFPTLPNNKISTSFHVPCLLLLPSNKIKQISYFMSFTLKKLCPYLPHLPNNKKQRNFVFNVFHPYINYQISLFCIFLIIKCQWILYSISCTPS